MKIVGSPSAYAIEINDNGLIQGLFYHGEKIDFVEKSQIIFNDVQSYPVFNWTDDLTRSEVEGPRYVIVQKGVDSQRKLDLFCWEGGDLQLRIQVVSLAGGGSFDFPIKKEKGDEYVFDNGIQNDWEVNVSSDGELGNRFSLKSPSFAIFEVKKKLVPLSIVVTDNAAEAAEIASQVSNGKGSVLLLPTESGDVDASEFVNSPQMRAIFSQRRFRITTSKRLEESLAGKYQGRYLKIESIVQNKEWEGELRTPVQTLPEALLHARLGNFQLIVDEEAPPVEAIRNERMVFYVGDGINALAAANYAFDVGAGLQRIDSPEDVWTSECLECLKDINEVILSNASGGDLGPGIVERVCKWARQFVGGMREQDSITVVAERLLTDFEKRIQDKYGADFDGVAEACVFWETLDVPLSLGFDIPIGHLPMRASCYLVSREVRRFRETPIGPPMLTVNTPGLNKQDAGWVLEKTLAAIRSSSWYVSIFENSTFGPEHLLRFYPSDVYYFITHGSLGAMSIGKNENLLAKELADIRLTSSPFIINNSCISWPELGAAALRAGAIGYVGTLWPVRADHAVALGAKLVNCLEQGMTWGQALHKALRNTPLREKAAYFLVGSPFRSYCEGSVVSDADRHALRLHALGRCLTEQSGLLAVSNGRNSNSILLKMILPLLLLADGKDSVVPGWDWVHMARFFSVDLIVSNIYDWKESKEKFFHVLKSMMVNYADDEKWKMPGAIEGARASFATFLFFCVKIMGGRAMEVEDWESAKQAFNILIDYCEEWGYGDSLPVLQNNMAKALLRLNELDEAESLLKDSLEGKGKVGDLSAMMETLFTLSMLKQMRGEHKEAVECLDSYIYHVNTNSTNPTGMTRKDERRYFLALSNRAMSLLALGERINKAITDLYATLQGFKRLNLTSDILKSYLQLYEAHHTIGEIGKAKKFLKKAITLGRETGVGGVLGRELEKLVDHYGDLSCEEIGAAPEAATFKEKNVDREMDERIISVQERAAEKLVKKAEEEGKVDALSPKIALMYYVLKKAPEALKWFRRWDAGGFDTSELDSGELYVVLVSYEHMTREMCSNDEVEVLFNRLISKFTEVAALWTEFGTWLQINKRPLEAKPYLAKALELDPNDSQAVVYLSEIMAEDGDLKGAINLLGPMALREHSAELFFRLGKLHYSNNEFSAAKSILEKSASLGETEALLYLVKLYDDEGSYNLAIQKAKEYIHQHPLNCGAWVMMCSLLLADGAHEKALDASVAALVLGPMDSLPVVQWFSVFIDVKDRYSQVASRYKIAMSSIAEFSNLLESMGETSHEELLKNLASSYGENKNYICGVISCCVHSHNENWELAEEVAKEISRKYPDDFLSRLMLHYLSIHSGRAKERDYLGEVRKLLAGEVFHYPMLLELAFTLEK